MIYNRTQVIVKDQYGRDVLCDSSQEADYYLLLLERLKNGEISDLQCHPEFVLQPPFFYEGQKVNGIVYTPDFLYIEKGKTIAIEVKGIITPDFELRLKMWKYHYPDIHIQVMAYSKKTGWLELKAYKKARKQIVKEELEARTLRKAQEQKEKADRKKAKDLARYEQLLQKSHLTTQEKVRLNRIKLLYNELLEK